MDNEKCCGTCKFHHYEKNSQDWSCANEASENWAEFTGYEDCCENWEEKD